MIVGEDVAVGINQEARTGAFNRHGIVEEIVLDGARDDISHRRRGLTVDANVFRFAGIELGVAALGGAWRGKGTYRRWRADAVARADPVSAQANNQADREQPHRASFVPRACHDKIILVLNISLLSMLHLSSSA